MALQVDGLPHNHWFHVSLSWALLVAVIVFTLVSMGSMSFQLAVNVRKSLKVIRRRLSLASGDPVPPGLSSPVHGKDKGERGLGKGKRGATKGDGARGASGAGGTTGVELATHNAGSGAWPQDGTVFVNPTLRAGGDRASGVSVEDSERPESARVHAPRRSAREPATSQARSRAVASTRSSADRVTGGRGAGAGSRTSRTMARV